LRTGGNLLLLDEPTNDLDAETLELLEEQLLNYEGTLLLVSHDRALLNNIVTSTLVLEGDGVLNEYIGGYDDYLRQRSANPGSQKKTAPTLEKPKLKTAAKKLSYKDQQILEALPKKIEALEQQQRHLQDLINEVGFYQQSQDKIQGSLEEMQTLETEIAAAYRRWEELS